MYKIKFRIMKNKHLKLIAVFFLILACSKDDDVPTELPDIRVSINRTVNTVEEPSNNGKFVIDLSETFPENVTVNLSIAGTATNGEDYQSLSTSIIIPANTESVDLLLNVVEDDTSEENETVLITITDTNQTRVIIGSSSTATIVITDTEEAFVLQPEDTATYMVNPNATPETVALFYNLKTIAKTNFIVGQHDAFNSFYNDNAGDSDIKKTTGSDPGLLGSDFMFITDDDNAGTSDNWYFQQEEIIKSDAAEAYNKGMVNVFVWHLREPYEGEEFYTSEMTTFQKNNAFKSLLVGGGNHEYYKAKLDKVADVANTMVGSDGKLVPFIFRPFHEFDGDWFWWGAPYCTPQEFIELWRFTVEYLRDTKGVNNMLFAYSPDKNYNSEGQYLSRYPGDNYVDVLGMDNYGDVDSVNQMDLDNANTKLKIISDLAIAKVKIAALTETCYFVTPGQNSPIPNFYAQNLYNVMTNNDVELAFMMFWSNKQDTYCIPTPGLTSTPDFMEFIQKPEVLLENELSNMYVLPN